MRTAAARAQAGFKKKNGLSMTAAGALLICVLFPLFTACDPEGSQAGPSPYITEVFDYKYGVGHPVPRITDPAEQKARFKGSDTHFVYLGGWGGYIVAGFGHDIENRAGYHNFAVYTQPGVGDKPGVVYVRQDHNGTGKPDGTWYELSGSETDKDYEGRFTWGYAETYSGNNLDTIACKTRTSTQQGLEAIFYSLRAAAKAAGQAPASYTRSTDTHEAIISNFPFRIRGSRAHLVL